MLVIICIDICNHCDKFHMGSRQGFMNIFLNANLYGKHLYKWLHFPEYRHIFSQYTSLPRNITSSAVRLNTFSRETMSCKEMDEESNKCIDKEKSIIISKNVLETKSEQPEAQNLSRRAQKRLARAQKHKEYKRQKREEQSAQREDIGYSIADLQQSSYYFENGVRKVYPYHFVFSTHAKGRWIGRNIRDVLEQEFGYDHPDDLIKSFERKKVLINGRHARMDDILKENDYISHKTHRHENPVTSAPIEIIENTDDLLVINKPSSIPCHPCGRYRFNSVSFILGKEMGLINLRNIYRLDRLTSGILMLGKTPERTKVLMTQISNRQMEKTYVCRVVGKFPDGTVKVDQPLMALSNKLRLQVVSPAGKSSQTTFTRISYNGRSSVVQCIPHTGRTHQIRVHLQYLGHPILNDGFYNSTAWGPNKGKGGVYKVPFDKVCEQMMTEHHTQQWVKGDNPLYEQKLKEMKSEQLCNGSTIPSSVINSSTAEVSQDRKIHTDIAEISSVDSVESGHRQTQQLQHSQNMSLSVDSLDSKSSVPNVSSISETLQSQLVPPSGEAKQDIPGGDFPGFDVSKWSIDPDCDCCKKKMIDPQEKHLIMFLHAFKYKGPGWEYEAAMPDWASDDWNREDDFLLENTTLSHD